jgi:hypothetical protein
MARRIGKLAALAGAKRLARANAPVVHQGIDTAARAVTGRLGHRHAAKVDGVSRLAKKALTGTDAAPVRGGDAGRPGRTRA